MAISSISYAVRASIFLEINNSVSGVPDTGIIFISVHGRRKDFFQEGVKVVKFDFTHSKLKQPLFAENLIRKCKIS